MSDIKKIILLIETSWAYGRGLLSGIARYSKMNGLWAVHRENRMLEDALPELLKMDADGMILRGSPDPKVHKLLDTGIPSIILHYDKEYPQIPTVKTNNASVSELAFSHLLDRGIKKFAFCGLDEQWSHERQKAFSNIVLNSDYEYHAFKLAESPQDRIWGKELPLMIEWLKGLPKPIGIMACNDDRAMQIMEACQLAEIDIPEKVALIGCDDDEFVCNLSNPTLTSISLNTEKAGFEAASLLNSMITGRNTDTNNIVVQATRVNMRQSTDLFAIDDSDVLAAVKYIRSHSQEPIQVSDVVDAAMVSRRNLQQKFKNLLGHSIYDEIRKARTQQIVEMLVNTALPISKIARELGFPGIEHVSRFFKHEKGISPQEYRKKNIKFL